MNIWYTFNGSKSRFQKGQQRPEVGKLAIYTEENEIANTRNPGQDRNRSVCDTRRMVELWVVAAASDLVPFVFHGQAYSCCKRHDLESVWERAWWLLVAWGIIQSANVETVNEFGQKLVVLPSDILAVHIQAEEGFVLIKAYAHMFIMK